MTRQHEARTGLPEALAVVAVLPRQTGDAMRAAARRASHAGTSLSRRTWTNAVESSERAGMALRVLRGRQPIYRWRPAGYVAAGLVTGSAIALAAAALARSALRRPEGTPVVWMRLRYRLDPGRGLTGRAVTGGTRSAPAAQDKAAQDKATQDKATQDKATRDETTQDKAAQDKAAQDKAAQDKATQDKAARDKATQTAADATTGRTGDS